MAQIIPVASGKGGVGKSLLSANLAIALGQQGNKVVLVDLDLGASNLHLVIGQHPGAASLGSWFTDKIDFKDIIQPTDYDNVSFIAGDSQIPDLTSLKHVQKVKLIRNLKNINTPEIKRTTLADRIRQIKVSRQTRKNMLGDKYVMNDY